MPKELQTPKFCALGRARKPYLPLFNQSFGPAYTASINYQPCHREMFTVFVFLLVNVLGGKVVVYIR